ncbi:MAG: HRDC domain-containing protein [Ideonella sp.]|nr:HRDC domain-containing protein [Ideonella sp.]
MSLHCFFVPARAPELAQSELNAFLAAQRVLAVQREWLADGAHSGWAFCVETVAGPGPLPAALKAGGGGSRRSPEVDYKRVLSPADFARYAHLRDWRKQAAQAEGVPLYALFSNEQLAAIVTQGVASLAALGQVDGVGAARVAKYGAALLLALQAPLPEPTPEEGA